MHSKPNKVINFDFILVIFISVLITVLVILVVFSFKNTGSIPSETESDRLVYSETSYVEDTSASEEESTTVLLNICRRFQAIRTVLNYK